MLGAEIVIVALPFPGATVGVPGTPGTAIVHCAVKVKLLVTFEIAVAALVVVAPSLHPVKVNPDFVGAVAVVKL